MKVRKKLAVASLVVVFAVNQSFSTFAATFTVSNPVLISKSIQNGKVTVKMKGVINASPSSFCLGLTEYFNYKTSFGDVRESKKMTNQTTTTTSSSFTYEPTITYGEYAVSLDSIVSQGFAKNSPTGSRVFLETKKVKYSN
ncbi:MAG: hypothetical protein K2N61_09875 [Lachnospiraceae bacterium]|nr:hypothetical protein [Lachnospiraceae bacterium]